MNQACFEQIKDILTHNVDGMTVEVLAVETESSIDEILAIIHEDDMAGIAPVLGVVRETKGGGGVTMLSPWKYLVSLKGGADTNIHTTKGPGPVKTVVVERSRKHGKTKEILESSKANKAARLRREIECGDGGGPVK